MCSRSDLAEHVQRNLGLLLGTMAAELNSWLEGQACRAAALLRSCAWLAEDSMALHLSPLLLPICKVRTWGEVGSQMHAMRARSRMQGICHVAFRLDQDF